MMSTLARLFCVLHAVVIRDWWLSRVLVIHEMNERWTSFVLVAVLRGTKELAPVLFFDWSMKKLMTNP